MKKFFALFLVFFIVFPTALAEEYVLGDGIWLIGEDIPSGYYTTADVSTAGSYLQAFMADAVDAEGNPDMENMSEISQYIISNYECYLIEGYYLFVMGGRMSFTPKPVPEETDIETYIALQKSRNLLILGYHGVTNIGHFGDAGTYLVGADIPSGTWCIAADTMTEPFIVTIQNQDSKQKYQLCSPYFPPYQPGDLTSLYLNLTDGDIITIDSHGDMNLIGFYIFPYTRMHEGNW